MVGRFSSGWGWIATAVLATAGCAATRTPSAMVAPTIGTAGSAEAPWLESATIAYIKSPTTKTSGAVATASYTSTPPADEAMPGPARVLAVRYPHPDGRRDVARAELLMADVTEEARRAGSWSGWLGQALGGALPGVEWGPGIKQAKGLDLPVGQLQSILAAAEASAVANRAAPATAAKPSGRFEINGRSVMIDAASALAFDRLAARVASEGRLISYHGRASELLAAMGERPMGRTKQEDGTPAKPDSPNDGAHHGPTGASASPFK